MARTLRAAYGDGLLSEETLSHRLDVLFRSRLIEPATLVGDLSIRAPRRAWAAAARRTFRAFRTLIDETTAATAEPPAMLALDWAGGRDELVIGRHPECDIVLAGASVSRRHARLRFRDGTWILQDLDSTNGTWVNDARVGRCQLRPGDRVELGSEHLIVD
jgi:pSer/pThr/pTyr-binding forkhead associated (FHA) protein